MTTDLLPDPGPEPGHYARVPASDYHAWQYCSAHGLMRMAASPMHCRYMLDTPDAMPDSASKRIGSAAHAIVLEPEVFDRVYVTAQTCTAKKKDGGSCTRSGSVVTDEGQWFCAQHAKAEGVDAGRPSGRIVISADEYQKLVAMRESLHANPDTAALLEQRTHTEESLVWDDVETGQRCKARLDGLVESFNGRTVIPDVKTCSGVGDEFERQILNFRYHWQAAHYFRGAAACGLLRGDPVFGFLAVETSPPYASRYVQLGTDYLELGDAEIRPLIELFAECTASGVWPGPASAIAHIPEWRARQLARAQELA